MEGGSRQSAAGAGDNGANGALLAALNGGDSDKAEGLARALIERVPDNAFAWEALSIALFRKGVLDESIDAGRRAIALNPKVPDYHPNLGVVLRAANRREEAKEAYRAALRCDKSFAAAHHNLGNLWRDESRFDEARACYAAAMEARPIYPEAWHGLGITEQSRGRFEEVVAQALSATAALQQRTGVEIVTRLAHELPPLRMDQRRLALESPGDGLADLRPGNPWLRTARRLRLRSSQ